MTFKQFLFIPQRTPSTLVGELIGRDLTLDCELTVANCRAKWAARLNYSEEIAVARKDNSTNPLRTVPSLFCNLVRADYTPCRICLQKKQYKLNPSWHRLYVHQVCSTPSPKIWREGILPIIADF